MKKEGFFLVDSAVLPEVFIRVIAAKKLLDSGEVHTIHEASEMAGVSRSAFYKYKDSVFPFHEYLKDRIVTLFFKLLDTPGVLSEILHMLAEAGANILTINQNIPSGGIANMTISFQSAYMEDDIEQVIERLKTISGVRKIEIF